MAIIYIDIYKTKHNSRTLTQPHTIISTTSKLSTTTQTNIYTNHLTLHQTLRINNHHYTVSIINNRPE